MRILMVCHGNICRSPLAEFLLRDMAERAGRGGDFEIASAAVSDEEIGNPIYPPVKRILREKGIACEQKRARRITKHDYDYYDRIIGMDERNRAGLLRFFGGDPAGKISLLLPGREVADPWYTGDFERTLRDITEGCERILTETKQE